LNLIKSLNTFIVLILVLALSSCVGTVEEKNPKATKAGTVKKTPVPFSGLVNAKGIAHDKVELFWLPASGAAANIVYEIYIDNSVSPISIAGTSLQVNSIGQVQYTVTGLDTNKNYLFSVGVRDLKEGTSSENNKTMDAKTFANYTADFMGVNNVRQAAGAAGKTTLIVEWTPATMQSPLPSIPFPFDPVAYEVSYLNSLQGKPSDLADPENSFVVTKQFPGTITPSSGGIVMGSTPIANLSAGNTYYIMVRAIHSDWMGKKDIVPNYKREMNTKFIQAKTINDSGVFSLPSDVLTAKLPEAGNEQNSKVELEWTPAQGSFNNYRVYWRKAAEPNSEYAAHPSHPTPLDPFPGLFGTTVDPSAYDITDPEILLINAEGEKATVLGERGGGDAYRGFFKVNADRNYTSIEGLEPYAYYNILVRACEDTSCTSYQETSEIVYRVVPKLAPFQGIATIHNPKDTSNLRKIEIDMNAPLTSSGQADGVEIWCLNDEADATPNLMAYNVPVNDPASDCHNVTLKTTIPTSPAGIGAFSGFDIELDSVPPNGKRYCFAVVPYLDGDYTGDDVYDLPAKSPNRDLSNAVVRCIVPEVKSPNLVEFPGRNLGCSIPANSTNIDVTWALPTSGQYENFIVFWKEKNSVPFTFGQAISELGTQVEFKNSKYSAVNPQTLNDTDQYYQIRGLEAGKRYQFGVMTFIDESFPSVPNTRTDECLIPLPKAKFLELSKILAIGPKENGLDHQKSTILEHIDASGIPIEVHTEANVGDFEPSTHFIARYGDISAGAVSPFNGIFGRKDLDTDNDLFKYSNNGVIQFGFKDYELTNGNTLLDHGHSEGELDLTTDAILGLKKDLKYGYKIYRSDDGLLTWNELTDDGSGFQYLQNKGLVTAKDTNYRKKNNGGLNPYDEVIFTDYSVSNGGYSGEAARAKIYYYRIEPIFNGFPIEYDDPSSTDHIIKITLPPPNMAYVDRRMANKTICEELGKDYKTGSVVNEYYSCNYNGLGASGLGAPYSVSTMVYDLGGDLLVDRFELGCNFTRGHQDDLNSKVVSVDPDARTYDFKGLAGSGEKFVGCLYNEEINSIGPSKEPGAGHTGAYTLGPFQVRRGDCFGSNIDQRKYNTCPAGSGKSATNRFTAIPGTASTVSTCEDDQGYDLTNAGFLDVNETQAGGNTRHYSKVVAQGEFGAVAYNRALGRREIEGQRTFRGALDKVVKSSSYIYPSNCYINLPSIAEVEGDTTDAAKYDGRFKPRWIPLNNTDRLLDQSSNPIGNILKKTVAEVLADTDLYDQDATLGDNRNNPPTGALKNSSRFSDDTKIGRIVTSNSAKLPPLGSLSQKLANDLCEQYEVEVGVESPSGFSIIEAAANKRLLRRKEFIAAGAWPREFIHKKVSEIEKGIWSETPGGANSDNNSSCNGASKNTGPGQLEFDLEFSEMIGSTFPYVGAGAVAGNVTSDTLLLTGSSIYDGGLYGGAQADAEKAIDKNTQYCQSMFGIQDLAGNVEEYSSDQIFCNEENEEILLARYPNDPLKKVVGNGTTFNASGTTVYVSPSTASGRCSMHKNGSRRPAGQALEFVTADDLLHPPYYGSTPNPVIFDPAPVVPTLPDLVEPFEEKVFDKASLNDARSGDGFFLDFGNGNLAPALLQADSAGLVFDGSMLSNSTAKISAGSDPRQADYFNPVLGLPVWCDDGACNTSSDNRGYTTKALRNKGCDTAMTFDTNQDLDVSASNCTEVTPSGVTDLNFPVNNSQIRTGGVSETHISPYYTRVSGSNNAGTFNFWDWDGVSAWVNVGPTPFNSDEVIPGFPTYNNVDVNTNQIHFDVDRNAPVYFKNGGERNTAMTGRYTATITGKTHTNQSASQDASARCVIKINKDGIY